MKLYSVDLSPYATRVRIQIRMKNLPIEILPPPEQLRTPEFRAKFTLGKIPVLELPDGSYIPDSWVIMGYLEDTHPETPLRPTAARARADMNLLARFADTYLTPTLFPLFQAFANMPNEEGKKAHADNLKIEVAKLDALLSELPDYTDRDIHLGDIALAPNLFLAIALAPMFGEADLLSDLDNIRGYWQYLNTQTEIKKGVDEMSVALKVMMGDFKA